MKVNYDVTRHTYWAVEGLEHKTHAYAWNLECIKQIKSASV